MYHIPAVRLPAVSRNVDSLDQREAPMGVFDGNDFVLRTQPSHNPHMDADVRKIVDTVVAPVDPLLARRIHALLSAYARGKMRHQAQHGPLARPHRGERRADDTTPRDPAHDA